MTPTLDILAASVADLLKASGKPVPWETPPPVVTDPPRFTIELQGAEAPAVVYVRTNDRSRFIDFQWDFGDTNPTAIDNIAPGRTCAHLYENPGTYTIKLTDDKGTTEQTVTVKTPARTMRIARAVTDLSTIPDNTHLLIQAGTYTIAQPIKPGSNVFIEAESQPVRIVRNTPGPIFDYAPGAKDILIWGIDFDTDVSGAPTTIDAGKVEGTNISIIGCKYGNLTQSVWGAGRPRGAYIAYNKSTERGWGHSLWMEGSLFVAVGNDFGLASTDENTIRMADTGVVDGLIWKNIAKGNGKACLVLRTGLDIDVIENKLLGPVAGCAPRTNMAEMRNTVFARNTFGSPTIPCFLELRIGVHGCDVRGNDIFTGEQENIALTFVAPSAPEFTGMTSSDISIRGNRGTNPITGKAFVKVYGSKIRHGAQVVQDGTNTFNGKPAPAPRFTEA